MIDPAIQIQLARLLAMSPDERAQALAAIDDVALRDELAAALLAMEAESEAPTHPDASHEGAATRAIPYQPANSDSRLAVHSTGLQGKQIGPYTLDAWIGDGVLNFRCS